MQSSYNGNVDNWCRRNRKAQVERVVGRRTDFGASSLPDSTLTPIVLRTGTGKLPGAGERKEAPRSAAKGRATDERSDASNFINRSSGSV
jgi:hypothetical protein